MRRADLNSRDRGIMVRSPGTVLDPVVDMQMFDFGALLELGADESMVELLRVHVEDISVSFDWWNTSGLINVLQMCAERVIDCARLSVFVKVP